MGPGPAGAAAVVLLGMPAAVGAAETGEDVQLETVTVVGKRPEPLQQAAAAVSVISSDEIEAAVAFELGDLLRREPGVSVPHDPQRFGDSGITVRGLGGNRVHMETDGVPAAKGFAVGSFSNAGRQFADLELIERVELLRGPASALYGSDAIAGVLATTTLDPADILTPGTSAILRARAGYADDDGSKLVGLTGAVRAGRFESLLGVAHRDAGAVDHAGGTPPPNPRDYSSDALLARAVAGPERRPLRFTAQWSRERVRTDVDALELSAGRFANTVLLEGDDRTEGASVLIDQTLGGSEAFDHGAWRAFWSETDFRQRTHEERRAVPPALPPSAIDREFLFEERTAGAELTLERTFETATGSHGVLGGIEVLQSRMTERRDGLQTNLDTGESTSTILGEALPVRDFPISRVREAGLYLQDDWRPAAGSWSLIPALRADWYRLEPQPDPMYEEDNPNEPAVAVEEFSLSPKLGVARRLSGGSTAYLQYAHGFRAPPFDDVNIGLDLPLFNVRAIPNPDLESERSDSLELGLRLAGASVRGSAAAFASRYRDFIESRVNVGTDPATGTVLFQSRNLAEAEIWGVEAEADIALGALHRALAGFTGRFAASWTKGEDGESGKPINSIDPPRGLLGIGYEASSGAWGGGLELTFVGAKDDLDQSAGPLFSPGGYSVLDLRLQWRPSAGLTAGVGLFNLADRRYYEWATVRGLGPDDPLLPLYRAPGRSFAVTLTATFD